MPSYVNLGWRSALTDYGDTLQRIAARELQDASRWPEIAWLNDLRAPYLTGSKLHPGVASGHVLVWGSPIKIPSPSVSQTGVTPTEAFGRDVALVDGFLQVDDRGGLVVADGVPNLKQALELRLRVELGDLQFHPRYGNAAHRLRGRKSDANVRLLALRYCEETVLADPRVKSVSQGVAVQSGDSIAVTLTAFVDDGSALRLQVSI